MGGKSHTITCSVLAGAQTRLSSTTTTIQVRIVHLTRATDLQVAGRGFLRGAEHEAEDRFPVERVTQLGCARSHAQAGTLHGQARGAGAGTSRLHSLLLAGEAETRVLTRSATSGSVARQGPRPWDFPATSWSQLPLPPPGR